MSLKRTNIKASLQQLAKILPNWLGPIVLTLGIIFGISIAIPTSADIYQHWQNIEPKNRTQTGINLLQTAATTIGGIAIFWNIVLSRRQLATSQEKNLTERFSVAVGQLGHKQTAVRIGGIYSLERIAQDSPRDYWTVMEILSAFIRDRLNFKDENDLPEQPRADKDITPAIIVLGRRDHSRQPPKSPIFLQACDFRRCSFVQDNFQNTFFHRSHFGNGNLSGTNFQGSNFRKSNFTETNLKNANLSDTNLTRAKFIKADVTHCNFQNADLSEADLSEAKGLTVNQIKSARNWQAAIYDYELMVQLGLTSNG